MTLPHRPLGESGIELSIMSLGSWRTYERLSRDEGIADEVTIANKLWWEHRPDDDATTELDGSLGRIGLDHVELIDAIAPPPTLPVDTVVEQVAGLIASGRARTWGTGMWSGEALAAALDVCDTTGAPRPVAAQMGCSLAEHRQASDPTIRAALDRGPIGLVATHVLAGGTLSGKYLDDPGRPGRAGNDDSVVARHGREIAARLAELGAEWGVETTHLALAYALGHPNLASLVFGATDPAQVRANIGAVDTFESLDEGQRATIDTLA